MPRIRNRENELTIGSGLLSIHDGCSHGSISAPLLTLYFLTLNLSPYFNGLFNAHVPYFFNLQSLPYS